MTAEERLGRMEQGIQGLIVVSRTALTSIQELRTIQDKTIQDSHELYRNMIEEVRGLHKHTDEKINILIDTVDRIITDRNHIDRIITDRNHNEERRGEN
jgi:hypothetical protein